MIGAAVLFALVGVGFGLTLLIARQGQHDYEWKRRQWLDAQILASEGFRRILAEMGPAIAAVGVAARDAAKALEGMSDAMRRMHS